MRKTAKLADDAYMRLFLLSSQNIGRTKDNHWSSRNPLKDTVR